MTRHAPSVSKRRLDALERRCVGDETSVRGEGGRGPMEPHLRGRGGRGPIEPHLRGEEAPDEGIRRSKSVDHTRRVALAGQHDGHVHMTARGTLIDVSTHG